MKLEQYNQLKKVIQEANPEIMSWQDGVKISIKYYTNENSQEIFTNEPNKYEEGIIFGDYVYVENDSIINEIILTKEKFINGIYEYGVDINGRINVESYIKAEILGRPIRFSDILIALGSGYANELTKITDNGELFWKFDSSEPGFVWNLHQNDLDWHYINKTDTVEVLYNLLVK